MPNALINESSPYLLQHAHNPVGWMAWGPEALAIARAESKLLLVSIGYSACHWCHVMEHESFEDAEVAELMNRHFVCIKVDREERTDIDQLYMEAVQIMTGQGGWPLNCIALPDGRPIYGGTYFPKAKWMALLDQLADLWQRSPNDAIDYAEKLAQGIRSNSVIDLRDPDQELHAQVLTEMLADWLPRFDTMNGGLNRAPKFPMPCSWSFLLKYGHAHSDQNCLDQVHLTLRKMALGGIMDQVGGGFARYSVDGIWKVPHFEKMLYDNGQLLSLYAEAHRQRPNPLYVEVMEGILDLFQQEMTAPEGYFYAALDADSEGEEGLYYLWNEDELQEILGDDATWVARFYGIGAAGMWEHGKSIPLGHSDPEEFAKSMGWDVVELKKRLSIAKQKLMEVRKKRIAPGLDDKQITGWNALALHGLVDAAKAVSDPRIMDMVLRIAHFITVVQRRADGGLWHTYKAGQSTVRGFLDDHALSIDALISLYSFTFDEHWLREAEALTNHVIANFSDATGVMFYFTDKEATDLIARTMETQDNVIPASNSVMAKNLFTLSRHLDRPEWANRARQMLANVAPALAKAGPWYSNWADLLLTSLLPKQEVVICGPDALSVLSAINKHYLPHVMLAGADRPSNLPLLQGRWDEAQTRIFVCRDGACQLPVFTVDEALSMLD